MNLTKNVEDMLQFFCNAIGVWPTLILFGLLLSVLFISWIVWSVFALMRVVDYAVDGKSDWDNKKQKVQKDDNRKV